MDDVMTPTPLWAEQTDLPAAALPGVNNSPLSYQLRSHRGPADKALQSAAVPLSQFFPAFSLLAFCFPHLHYNLFRVRTTVYNIPQMALI